MRDIIIEEIRKFLLEDKASDRAKTARNFLANNNYDGDTFVFVNVYVKKSITTLKDYKCKYILGITRMAFNGDFGELDTNNEVFTKTDIINKVDEILTYFYHNEEEPNIKKINEDLDGMSAQSLIDRFYNDAEKYYDNVINSIKGNDVSGYKIIEIKTFEEAKKYSKYVDWCVTTDSRYFDKYTYSNTLSFFFCLKEGYDKIQRPEVETGNPKDEYGLSMIAVVLFGNGSIKTTTTRWNHKNGGNDHMFNLQELVNTVGNGIIGCIKKTKENSKLFFNNIESRIDGGSSLDNIFQQVIEFGNIKICRLYNEYYILDSDNKFLYKTQFNDFFDCKNGLIKIRKGKNFNCINKHGVFPSKEWFNSISEFTNGFSVVIKDNKQNYLNKDGYLLSDEWFDYCMDFQKGFGEVIIDGKYNILTESGELLFNENIENSPKYSGGLFSFKDGDKWNYINLDGELISDESFDYCDSFSEGFGGVKVGGKWNYINLDGEFLLKKWVDQCDTFSEGFGVIKIDGLFNYVDKNGDLLSDEWFESCERFSEGYGVVENVEGFNYIDDFGYLLSDEWFDYCWSFENGFGQVLDNDLDCYIDKNGKLYDENKKPIQENKSIDLMKRMMLL